MTLITHIWTTKVNVISGDGRFSNKTRENPIVVDNCIKIFPNDNYFIAFSGKTYIKGDLLVPNELDNFINTFESSDPKDVAHKVHKHFKELDPDIKTLFFVGGQLKGKAMSYFCDTKNETITEESNKKTTGLIYSYNSVQQHKKLLELLNLSFQNITGNEYDKWSAYDEYTNEEFKQILLNFHEAAFNDPVANPEEGIGPSTDIGIIRNQVFESLHKENKKHNLTV